MWSPMKGWARQQVHAHSKDAAKCYEKENQERHGRLGQSPAAAENPWKLWRKNWLHVILRCARLEEQYVGNGDWGYFKQLYLSRKGRKLPAYAAEIMLTLVFQRKTPYNRKGMSNCKFPLNGITDWILFRQNRNRCLTQNLWRWSCLLAGCL